MFVLRLPAPQARTETRLRSGLTCGQSAGHRRAGVSACGQASGPAAAFTSSASDFGAGRHCARCRYPLDASSVSGWSPPRARVFVHAIGTFIVGARRERRRRTRCLG
jgi:hypothetical protein